jgi:hypothetical protein
MPVSAYLKAGLFVVAAATALFAAAGTVAIPGFWAYLAILAAVMIVSFAVVSYDTYPKDGEEKPTIKVKPISLPEHVGANGKTTVQTAKPAPLVGDLDDAIPF